MSQILKPIHHTQQWRLKRKKTVKIMYAVPLNLIIFLFIILFIIFYLLFYLFNIFFIFYFFIFLFFYLQEVIEINI